MPRPYVELIAWRVQPPPRMEEEEAEAEEELPPKAEATYRPLCQEMAAAAYF